MKFYKNTTRPLQPSADLETLAKSYDSLEKGHLKAVETATNLKTALAQLDLNPEEDYYRQQKYNQIRETIDNNSFEGNSYYALDDIIRTQGDIFSDDGLLGRLQAQKDYKANIEAISRRNDISDDVKEWAIDNNKYNYSGEQIDEQTGKVTKRGAYSKGVHPVRTISMTDAMTKALQFAAKEAGGSNQVRWLDANGNPTSDWRESTTGEYWDDITNSWTRLTKEKLSQALTAVMNSEPGLKSSLYQDYEVANWKADKQIAEIEADNNLSPVEKENAITNVKLASNAYSNGRKVDYQGFIDKMINPFYDAASFYNRTTNIKYGKAMSAQLELAAKQRASEAVRADINITPEDMSVGPTHMVETPNTMPLEATIGVNKNKLDIYDVIHRYDENFDPKLLEGSDEDILNYCKEHNIKGDDLYAITSSLANMRDNQEYLNRVYAGLDAKEREKAEAFMAISSGNIDSISSDNRFIKRYNNKIDALFTTMGVRDENGNRVVNINIPYDAIDNFLSSVNGEEGLDDLGIDYSHNGAYFNLSLKKDNINSLYFILNAVKQNRGIIDTALDSISLSSTILGNIPDRFIKSREIDELVDYVNRIGSATTEKLGEQTFRFEQTYIPYDSPLSAEYAQRAKSDFNNQSKWNANFKLSQEESDRIVRNNLNLPKTGAYLLNPETNVATVINNTQDLLALQNILADPNTTFETGLTWNPGSGMYDSVIRLSTKSKFKSGDVSFDEVPKRDTKDVNTITIQVPGAIQPEALKEWNNDTETRANAVVYPYWSANRDINLYDYNTFRDVPKVKLQPHYSDKGNYEIIYNNEPTGNIISRDEAAQLVKAYIELSDAYKYVKADIIPIENERLLSIISNSVGVIATQGMGYTNPDAINELIKQVSTNFIR